MLAKTEADLELLRQKARFERAQGVETEIVGPNELARLAPALARDYAGRGVLPDARGRAIRCAARWRWRRWPGGQGARPARGVAVLGARARGARLARPYLAPARCGRGRC